MDRLESGATLLALAPAAWLLGVFFFGADEGYGLPLAIILVGMGVAGWGLATERRGVAAGGLLVAAAGNHLFFNFSFAGGLAPFAGFVFCASAVVLAFAVLAGMRPVQAACLGAFAFAGVLWILSDLTSATWLVGNLLLVAGGTLGAIGALRDR